MKTIFIITILCFLSLTTFAKDAKIYYSPDYSIIISSVEVILVEKCTIYTDDDVDVIKCKEDKIKEESEKKKVSILLVAKEKEDNENSITKDNGELVIKVKGVIIQQDKGLDKINAVKDKFI